MKSPITAKLSAQKNEIQSHREPKGGASGMELRKDGKAKMRPLNIATFANSACRGKRWQSDLKNKNVFNFRKAARVHCGTQRK